MKVPGKQLPAQDKNSLGDCVQVNVSRVDGHAQEEELVPKIPVPGQQLSLMPVSLSQLQLQDSPRGCVTRS